MSEWQPIETAPRDGRDIQVYCKDTGEQFVAFWFSPRDCWCYAKWRDGGIVVCKPTHWMPLPEPPEDDQ